MLEFQNPSYLISSSEAIVSPFTLLAVFIGFMSLNFMGTVLDKLWLNRLATLIATAYFIFIVVKIVEGLVRFVSSGA